MVKGVATPPGFPYSVAQRAQLKKIFSGAGDIEREGALMMIGSVRSFRRALAVVFPERRIYLRTNGRTRYLCLGTKSQLAGTAAAVAMLVWTGFTTVAYVGGAFDGHAARIRIETMREAYETRIAALDEQQRAIEEQLHQANLRRDAVTERLSSKQAGLVETANGLQEAEAELVVLRAEFERLTDLRRADQARIEGLTSELARTGTALAQAEISERNLAEAFDAFGGTVDRVISERDEAVASMILMGDQLAELNGTLGRMEDREERLLGQIEDAARLSLAGLEQMFGSTDIDLDSILTIARRDYTGSGGPFLPLTGEEDAETVDTTEGDQRVAALMQDLETVNLMRFTADRLPFALPVQGGRFTSGFGPRSDPKGRGKSMHAGLDIAGPRGTAIHSTADGVVTFSGRQSGYGIMVKIRHAFGFETVYAHLSRTRVKVGQRVTRGDRIADMGSTGRSTGNHLHYEIRIDNEPVNPRKFIEAARDVL
jgi:murein DD-endopeptidase MepM/ murein hydrolase activator NlpD